MVKERKLKMKMWADVPLRGIIEFEWEILFTE